MEDRSNIRLRFFFVFVFLVVAALLVVLAVRFYAREKQRVWEAKTSELSAVASLKANQLSQWRKERLSEVLFFSSRELYARDMYQMLGGNGELQEWYRRSLQHIMGNNRYENIFVLGRDGSLLFSVLPDFLDNDSLTQASAQEVFRTGDVYVQDIYYCTTHRKEHINMMAPLKDNAGQVVAVLCFQVNPSAHLAPLIREWPFAGHVPETYIVRARADSVFVLSDYLHFPVSVGRSFPLTREQMPAVRAALGYSGIMEGLDPRGVEVIADVRPVPESLWQLVTEVEKDEVYAALNIRMGYLFFIFLFALFFVGAFLAWMYHLRQRNIHRRLSESEQNYRNLLDGMNETVWVIGLDGNLIDFNLRAEEILGYTRKELLDMGLSGIDASLEPAQIQQLVENMPSDRLQVFQTAHKRKDGGVFPVEICSSMVDYKGNKAILSIARDISRRKEMEVRLREKEDTIRLLFDSTAEGIYGIDTVGRCIFCNRSALQKLGYDSEEEVIGKDMHDLIHHSFADGTPASKSDCSIYRAFRERAHTHVDDEVFWTKHGRSFPVEYWSYPIEREGVVVGSVVTFLDITDRKTMIGELIQAKDKAEESDRLKSAFLANISHEIRTPMNGILGFLDLLRAPDLSESKKDKFTDVIHKSGQRLLATIQDIVEVSKIQSGAMTLDVSDVDVHEVLSFHRELFARQALDKGLNFTVEEKIPAKESLVRTDRNKLDGILTHLISNAVKFTSKGGVVVGNYLEDADMVFYVRDTGKGIPEEKRKDIFSFFAHVDVHFTRAHEGMGLGLPIVKAYVECLGGSIRLESEEGKGSTFYVRLPYHPIALAAPVVPSKPEGSEAKEGIKVLIAEDDPYGYQYLTAVLEEKVGKFIRTVDGIETVRIVRENPDIALVLMDIKMHGIDGLEATRQIRLFNKDIPIIAQTAHALAGDRERALAAGCNEYLPKPIKRPELLAMIEKFTA